MRPRPAALAALAALAFHRARASGCDGIRWRHHCGARGRRSNRTCSAARSPARATARDTRVVPAGSSFNQGESSRCTPPLPGGRRRSWCRCPQHRRCRSRRRRPVTLPSWARNGIGVEAPERGAHHAARPPLSEPQPSRARLAGALVPSCPQLDARSPDPGRGFAPRSMPCLPRLGRM